MAIAFALFLMHVLETMFFVGLVGSYAVAIISLRSILKNIDVKAGKSAS